MELLSVEEVARILHLHQMTVRRHIRQGRLKAVKVGGRVRIRAEDLEAFMEPIEQESKLPPWIPPPRVPTSEQLARRRAIAEEVLRLRQAIGTIGVPVDRLIRESRDEGYEVDNEI